ncbi:MAG: hypothetical protein ACE5IL_04815 [Myxococcota bacterium]
MEFILGWMVVMIGGSLLIEKLLPMSIKERLGRGICWLMMATTMTFLGLSTLGLVWVGWTNLIKPMLSS